MHSDDIARAYGFRGALVPGVTIFSHMTTPLIARLGAAWLARGWAEVRFAKPAYEAELLTISAAQPAEDSQTMHLNCENDQGEVLASMNAGLQAIPIPPDPRGNVPPAKPVASRQEATWELMEIGTPFPALAWHPTHADNREWCGDTCDDLPIYRADAAPLHPGLVLRQANLVLRNRFILPAWIHTASSIRFFDTPRPGHWYEVRAIPEEKWRRRGHEFVRLFVAVRRDNLTVAEIVHTAIFRPLACTPTPDAPS